jgi:hypothetical protein
MNFNHGNEVETPLDYDSNFEKKINAARQGIKKYRNALIKLAK